MDHNKRNQCIAQLQSLVSGLANSDDKSSDTLILGICVGLIQSVDNNLAVDILSEEELQERLEHHMAIYHSMRKFMKAAADTIDLDTPQKELIKSESLYQDREKDAESMRMQREELTRQLRETDAEIRRIYNENNGLISKVSEQTQKLEELKKLQAEYDSEKLSELITLVDQLQSNTSELKERYTVLNKQTAENLDELSATLEKIGKISGTHLQETERIRKDAIEFKKSIEIYCKTHQEYKAWFNVLSTPLQTLEKMIGSEEAKNLRGVMTQEELIKKNELVNRISKDLTELNRIAYACAKAAGKDYDSIVAESE